MKREREEEVALEDLRKMLYDITTK